MMEPDYLIESLPVAFGASKNRSYRDRAIARAGALIRFLQGNRLTRRTILEENRLPDESTEVWLSDLTAEGWRLIEAAHIKWLDAIDRGSPPEDTTILSNALARIRGPAMQAGNKPQAKLRKRRTAAQEAETGGAPRGQQARLDRYPFNFELKKELLREYERAGPFVYDKAEWHIKHLPHDLPSDQALVHTGMLVTWLAENDMIDGEFAQEAAQVKRRKIRGSDAYRLWDCVLACDILTEEGNGFVRDYYEEKAMFWKDYDELLVRGLPSFYSVRDTWKNYDVISKRISERFRLWKAKHSKT